MINSKKNILVTGGAGFIGSHTAVELFQSGCHPVIVDNLSTSDRLMLEGLSKITGEKVDFFEGDCTDREFLKSVFSKRSISAVMHFAAFKSVGESVEHPLRYFRNNIDSLIVLLEVMKEFGVRDFIFSSSCTVYGQPEIIPVNEMAPFRKAESPYGATKQIGEQILEASIDSGFRVVSLRYFNPVGAHPTGHIGELPVGVPNNLVPYITQTAAGVRKSLTVFGNDYDTADGSCIRDFIHVVDVARAHVKALEYLWSIESESNSFEAFNLGTGLGVSVLELIKSFETSNQLSLNYTIGARRPGDVVKVYADPSKIMKAMGWKPDFSLEEAMIHAWNWQKKISNIK